MIMTYPLYNFLYVLAYGSEWKREQLDKCRV